MIWREIDEKENKPKCVYPWIQKILTQMEGSPFFVDKLYVSTGTFSWDLYISLSEIISNCDLFKAQPWGINQSFSEVSMASGALYISFCTSSLQFACPQIELQAGYSSCKYFLVNQC